MRVCITGSQGFLGRWVVKTFNEAGIETRGIDISGNGDHIKADLTVYSHARSALAEINPDAVIHLAALAGASGKGGGAESLKNPYDYFKVNTMITLNVFEACRELRIKKVLCMSSFSPYGNAPVPITEGTHVNPENAYGGSKVNVETIARVYARCYDIKTLIFRAPLICGEGQKEMNALRQFADAALKDEPLEIWGDGSTIREFLHPSDVAEAYILGLKYLEEKQKGFDIFVLGNHRIKMKDLAIEIIDAVGKGSMEFLLQKLKLFDQYTNHNKAELRLGWVPKIGIREIVQRVVKDMRE